jgi:hypothetical protein
LGILVALGEPLQGDPSWEFCGMDWGLIDSTTCYDYLVQAKIYILESAVKSTPSAHCTLMYDRICIN